MNNGLLKQHIVLIHILILVVITVAIPALAGRIRVPGEYKTIQAAIDAARAGDLILVAPGMYHERLVLRPGLTLKSIGNDTRGHIGLRRAELTVINGGAQEDSGPGVIMAEGSTLDGFTIINVGRYDDEQWNRDYATQGSGQLHRNIGRRGTGGIAVPGIADCLVTNNIVHHNGFTGILVTGKPGLDVGPQITRNIVYRNMGGGIGSVGGAAPTISDNICYENFYAGIGFNNAGGLVTGNTCYNNIRAGIGISNNSCPVVRSNRCFNNRRAGIGVRTGAQTRPVIENNLCYHNDMAGIGSSDHAEPVILNNSCYGNKFAGIGVKKFARPEIVGNRCFYNKLSGIASQSGAAALIRENECFNNGSAGISQQGDAQPTIIENYCHHNDSGGIVFLGCSTGRATVKNNRVLDNDLVAVGIHEGWTVELIGNELSRRGGLPPIARVFKGASATFVDNLIRGQGVAGILVAGTVTASDNQFEGLALRKSGPPNLAVWAVKGARITLSKNQITAWQHALYATDATVNVDGNTVREFHKTAFMVHNAPQPANVFDNIVLSRNREDKVLAIYGASGNVANNELRPQPAPYF